MLWWGACNTCEVGASFESREKRDDWLDSHRLTMHMFVDDPPPNLQEWEEARS